MSFGLEHFSHFMHFYLKWLALHSRCTFCQFMYSLGVKLMILVPCSTVSGMNKYT